MHIYVASSWRNTYYPDVVAALRNAGHDVYDFRNPPSGDSGFHWTDVDAACADWTPAQYQANLTHPLAERQFKNDIDFNGAFDVNATRDAWTKLMIPVFDYNLTYEMNFSELQLEAKLVDISAVRKEGSDGIWRTEYVFSFNCDPDKDMIKALALYVKRKETDPESGKKFVATYHTELSEPKIVV